MADRSPGFVSPLQGLAIALLSPRLAQTQEWESDSWGTLAH